MHKARDGEKGLRFQVAGLLVFLTGHQPGSSLNSVLVNFHGNFMRQPWLIKSLVSSG